MTDRLSPGLRRVAPDLIIGARPPRLLRLSPQGVAALDSLLTGGSHPAAARLRTRLVRAGALQPVVNAGSIDDVTVVVPFAGSRSALERTLSGIPPGVPYIVIDDNPRRTGPAAARNRGARGLESEFIAFLDTDLDLPEGWLQTLTGHFSDPEVIAVAPRITSRPGTGWAGVLEEKLCALDLGGQSAVVRRDSAVAYLPSTGIIIRRSAFEAIGGFDETLLVGEDVDLSWRLLPHGQVRYDARVILRHGAREGLLAALNRRRDYGTSAALLEVRHPGSMHHLEVDRRSMTVAAAALTHPALGAIAVVGAIALAPRRIPPLPPREARRLAGLGLAQAAMGAGRYAVRPGLPLTLAAVALSRRTRRLLPFLIIAHLAGSRTRLAGVNKPQLLVLHVLDDLAYSCGVWSGAIRHRRPTVVLPHWRSSPDERPAGRLLAHRDAGTRWARRLRPVARRGLR